MRTKPVLSLFLALSLPALAATPSATTAQTIDLKSPGNSVEFLAIGSPSALKIRGKAKEGESPLEGALKIEGSQVSGTAKCKLDVFDTGIDLRNRHMKEKYLHTDKHPTADFKLTKMTLPDGFKAASFTDEKVPFEGDLTLHGTTKPVSGTAKVVKKDGKHDMSFEFKIGLEPYGIETPSFMGIKVTDQVTVFVNVADKTGT